MVTFNINLLSIQKSFFWFQHYHGNEFVRGTRDFLKLSFHMFPYNEILKVFKSKI